MSRVYGDDVELTSADASIVKGMIKRGDKNEAIASYFGVNQRAISHIRSGKKFGEVGMATQLQLPPPGPYGVDPVYVHFYRTMAKVNSLWDDKRLGEARSEEHTSELQSLMRISYAVFCLKKKKKEKEQNKHK